MSTELVLKSGQDALAAGSGAPRDDSRPYVWIGLLLLFGLLGGIVAWSANAQLDGAVIVPGTFTVESNRKTLQHLEGGIVSEILVKDGHRVEAGQVLLRLDGTVDRANSEVIAGQLDELIAWRARLRAERADAASLRFPPELLARQGEAGVAAILAGQADLFAARRAARSGQVALLTQRMDRFAEEIEGLEAQRASSERQIGFVEEELVGLRKLFEKGYARLPRILALEREAERIRGEVAEHAAGIARARNGIDELKLERLQAEREFQERVTTELRSIEPRIAALVEQQVAAEQRLSRVDLRAPRAGVVVGLKVNTIGGVVRPGEAILDLVPEGEPLVIEARVPTADVDKVAQGQASRVRLSAFDQDSTPEISGEVVSVSADSFADEATGLRYYSARIRLNDREPMGGIPELVPGMPAEVFINTGSRTALSYFVKPFTDRLARTFADG